jgi:hypothetical protein
LVVVLALIAALALAGLTVAIVSLASDNGGATEANSGTPAQVIVAQPYTARPGEGLGALVTTARRSPTPGRTRASARS